MAATFELPGRSTNQEVRNVVMKVLIGIAHVRAVKDERMVEQRAVAVRSALHLVDEIRKALHVVLVELGVLRDTFRILGMMRATVETQGGNVARRICTAGEVAGIQDRRNPCDVALEGQYLQVKVQLHVFIE